MNSESSNSNNSSYLSEIAPGKSVILVKVAAGNCFAGRLASLGIFAGTIIKVISNNFAGPMIVSVEGSRMAIGRGEAFRILVTQRD